MSFDEFHRAIASLRDQICDKYRIKAATLEGQLRKLGRGLPKYERGQAKVLIEAERALAHPKMAQRVQREPFLRAKTALELHLETVSAGDRFKGRVIGIMTVILVNLVIVAGVLVAFLRWRAWIVLKDIWVSCRAGNSRTSRRLRL